MLQHVYWITMIGWYHLVLLGIVVPFAVIRRRRKLVEGQATLPSRMPH